MIAAALMGTSIAAVLAAGCTVFRSSLGTLFSVDVLVQRAVASLAPILAAMLVGDAWNCVFSGELAADVGIGDSV